MDLYAHAKGDPLVGLPSRTWVVENIEPFEEKEHREEVRSIFTYSFALLAGEPVRVTFSDEHPD